MTDPTIVPAYGEDATAASMDKAAAPAPADAAAAQAKIVPDDVALPVAGTTETDLAANIAEAAKRTA